MNNGDLNQSEMSFSQTGKKKLVLKLVSGSTTKRVRELPENFVALKSQVKAQMAKAEQAEKHMILTNQYALQYQDDTGDIINVSDDEDLFAAYEVAEEALNGQLKLQVKPRPSTQSAQDLRQIIEEKQIVQPKSFVEQEEVIEPKSPKKNKVQKKEEMEQISSTFVKKTLDEMMNGETTGNEDDDDSSSSDDDEKKGKKKHCKKGKKDKKCKKDKHLKMDEEGKIPKKAFKKMIRKEMDKQCQQIFQSMFVGNADANIAQGEPVDDQINSCSTTQTTINPQSVVHPNVECDGCGMAPIVGPRYKCTVTKDFDFCSICEERKPHPHPFIKINKPGQAPTAIFTTIDENTPGKADIERDIGDVPPFFRNAGPSGTTAGAGQGAGPEFIRNMMSNFARGGFGGRGGWRGRCGGPGEGGGWRRMMRGGCPWRGRGQRADGTTEGPQPDAWRLRRAKVVSVPGVLSGAPGETLIATVDFKNETQQPLKHGCVFRGVFSGRAAQVLEDVVVPVDFQVTPFEVHSLNIPLKIKDSADVTDNTGEDHHVATFQFHGPGGRSFGEEFNIRFRVEKKLDEVEFYNKAMMLFQEFAQDIHTAHISFEKVVEVLKKAKGNANLAKELLKKMTESSILAASSQFEEMNLNQKDDEEDLYE